MEGRASVGSVRTVVAAIRGGSGWAR